MVLKRALSDTSSSSDPSWTSIFEMDAGLLTWDPFPSCPSQDPSTRPFPHQFSYSSQPLGPENERSNMSDAGGPSSPIKSQPTALQCSPVAECGLSTKGRPLEVRNPTGAPLVHRLSIASLLSPSDQNPRPKNYFSSPFCDGESQTNYPLTRAASKSLADPFNNSLLHPKAEDFADSTPRPSALHDDNPSISSSQRGIQNLQARNFQLERSHRGLQECLQQGNGPRATEPERFREHPTLRFQGDPFRSGSGSHPTAIDDGLSRRSHEVISRCVPPGFGIPEPVQTTEQGGRVEEAHFTTLTSSSRPQIITISRRGSSVRPVSHVNSPQTSSPSERDDHPITPPAGRATTPNTSRRISVPYETERTTSPGPPTTPPNSPVEGGAASPKVSSPSFEARDSRRASYSVKRSSQIGWILEELEFFVGYFPLTRPQLDSPAIQHIRREIFDRSHRTRSVSAGPQLTSHTLPHSRYSAFHRDPTFGSSFSDPLSDSSAEGFRGADGHGSYRPSFDSPYHINSLVDPPPMSATLYALRNVFPDAPRNTLDSIQATSYALTYVSRLYIFHSYSAATTPVQEKPSLTADFHPCFDVVISARRLECLKVGLYNVLSMLLIETDGPHPGKGARDHALARAVQEMIMLLGSEGDAGERGAGVNTRQESRRDSRGGGLMTRYDGGHPGECVVL